MVSDVHPDTAFHIELPVFEGPLDLLLHLIQKHELDILDLPIAFVTERYLDYLALMRKLNLDVASEYLVMAATLAHIKSKMLLPSVPEDQDEEELEDQADPREELIRRLLEYQKYKSAAENLGSRQVTGRDVFLRGTPGPKAQGPAPLAQVGLFTLLDAFQGVLKRAQSNLALEVSAERISIQDRIAQLTELLQTRRRCRFEELFESVVTRYDIVVTFLALLEMAKMRVARLYQADPHAPVYVQSGLLGENQEEPIGQAEGEAGPAEAPPAEQAGHDEPQAAVEQERASDDGMPVAGGDAKAPVDRRPNDPSDGMES